MVLISDPCADLEKSDIKTKTEGQQSPKVGEFESCEKGTPEDNLDEEDVCPICLEGLFYLIMGTSTLYIDMPYYEISYLLDTIFAWSVFDLWNFIHKLLVFFTMGLHSSFLRLRVVEIFSVEI